MTRAEGQTAGISHAHLASLDGLRAVAALMVLLTHAAFLTGLVSGGLAGRLLGRGDLGVAIFFSLSGFLLHRSMLADWGTSRWDVRGYYLRRFARVVPAYWITLAVVAVAVQPGALVVVLEALGLQIYARSAHIPEFSQSWSIATELSFYAVLPLLFLGLQRLRRRDPGLPWKLLLGALVAGLFAAWAATSGEIGREVLFERWLPARAANFALGMLLAEAALSSAGPVTTWCRRSAARPSTCLAVAAAAYLLSTTSIAGQLTLGVVSGLQLAMKMALSCVVTAGLMLPLLFGPPHGLRTLLQHPVARWLGTVSFGVFLWHLPVFSAMYAVTGLDYFKGGFVPLLIIGVPVTLAVAAASWYGVERPLVAWAHRSRRRTPPAPVPPRPAAG
jgi:peptidoglycan/LPS O-acetylase OafA/YrhL